MTDNIRWTPSIYVMSDAGATIEQEVRTYAAGVCDLGLSPGEAGDDLTLLFRARGLRRSAAATGGDGTLHVTLR